MTRGDFWSRRKAAVALDDKHAEDALKAEAANLEPASDEAADQDDASVLEQLGLPDPDTLGPGDDFRAFMAEAVPHRLRSRALRRLWVSNPVLANVDGLVDYADDFTDAATVIPGMQTAYQVGKGMKRHVEALLAQAEQEAEEAAQDETTLRSDPPEQDLIPVEDLEPVSTPAPSAETVEDAAPDLVAEQAVPPLRHMRFEFS